MQVTRPIAAFLLVGCVARAPQPTFPVAKREPSGSAKRVIVVSIDGLPPEAYVHPDAHGLSVPTLRRLVREGASSSGVTSVFPTVTYPAHTSMVTGVVPGKHGIVTNRSFDPLDTDLDGWRWYAEDITREPIWRTVERAGFTAATIWWPVTVGANVTWHVPEVWRAKNEGDKKLVRALSTPGLLDAVAGEHPDFWSRFTPPETVDGAVMDIALHVLASKPTLLLVHMAEVDAQQHDHGAWSTEAKAAIERVDAELARLLAAVGELGLAADTRIMIVSDHGFVNVASAVKPCVLLRDAGLVTTTEGGRITQWQAAIASSAGSAYVYLHDSSSVATSDRVRSLFVSRAKEASSGIARVYGPEEIAEIGGDPRAVLALEAVPGVQFASGCSGAYTDKASNAAVHGYDPRRPELRASKLFFGRGIPHGTIQNARLVDVAPTVAAWLGLAIPGTIDGRALSVVEGAN